MLEAELIAFGLSPKEAKVYISALELGEASASQIATHSGEPRLSTYSVLNRLQKRRFVTCYQKKRVRIYRVASPDSFLKHCDEQILTIKAKRDRLENFLPELKTYLSKNGDLAGGGHIRFIKDHHLFERRCAESLKKSNDWLVIQDAKHFHIFRGLFKQAQVTPRVILPLSEQRHLARQTAGMKVRYVPDSRLSGDVHVMIIGKRVMFVLEDEPQFSAVEIEYAPISEMLRVMFLLLFKMDFFPEEKV